MATYKTRDKQSVYDLAVQLYGDVSKIGNLLKNFSNLDSELALGSGITLEVQKDPIAIFFSEQKIIVATDFTHSVSEVDNILLESGDDILLEDGGLLLLES